MKKYTFIGIIVLVLALSVVYFVTQESVRSFAPEALAAPQKKIILELPEPAPAPHPCRDSRRDQTALWKDGPSDVKEGNEFSSSSYSHLKTGMATSTQHDPRFDDAFGSGNVCAVISESISLGFLGFNASSVIDRAIDLGRKSSTTSTGTKDDDAAFGVAHFLLEAGIDPSQYTVTLYNLTSRDGPEFRTATSSRNVLVNGNMATTTVTFVDNIPPEKIYGIIESQFLATSTNPLGNDVSVGFSTPSAGHVMPVYGLNTQLTTSSLSLSIKRHSVAFSDSATPDGHYVGGAMSRLTGDWRVWAQHQDPLTLEIVRIGEIWRPGSIIVVSARP